VTHGKPHRPFLPGRIRAVQSVPACRSVPELHGSIYHLRS
jgi:hypothetical protein